jgi:hypothetical protein
MMTSTLTVPYGIKDYGKNYLDPNAHPLQQNPCFERMWEQGFVDEVCTWAGVNSFSQIH